VHMPELESSGQLVNYKCFSANDWIDTAHIIQSSNLIDGIHESVMSLFERVGWAYNSHVTLESLEALYLYIKSH